MRHLADGGLDVPELAREPGRTPPRPRVPVHARGDRAQFPEPVDERLVGARLTPFHVLEQHGLPSLAAVAQHLERRSIRPRDRRRRAQHMVAPERLDPGEFRDDLRLGVIAGTVHAQHGARACLRVGEEEGRVLGEGQEPDLGPRREPPPADARVHHAMQLCNVLRPIHTARPIDRDVQSTTTMWEAAKVRADAR